MPALRRPEFRRRAVELARADGQPVAQLAKGLEISESCLRRWMAVDDVDTGRVEGLSTGKKAELAELRRRNRVLEAEVETLKRASALVAREYITPR